MAAPDGHKLPPHVQVELQRILDLEARRLLDQHLSGKADHSDLLIHGKGSKCSSTIKS